MSWPVESAAAIEGKEAKVPTFQNPQNDHRESVDSLAILWSLLFGWIYFAAKGLWAHIAIQVIIVLSLGMLTGGPGALIAVPLWLVYACLAPSIIAGRYRTAGWREVREGYPAVDRSASSEEAQVEADVARAREFWNPSPPPPAAAPTTAAAAELPSIASELEKLAGLHRAGALTDHEFATAKAALLRSVSPGIT